jgi:class 3 adenylate cyclase
VKFPTPVRRRAELTIFYVDVSGFTEMTERLGDALAFEVMGRYLQTLRAAASSHQGREIEIRGDACLLTFESPEEALSCAADVQRALGELRRAAPSESVGVRIGLHTGRPIRHEAGLFGRDVILAARLSDACPTHAILVSRAFRRRLRDTSRVGRERSVRLKGFREPQAVARAYWGASSRRSGAANGPLGWIATWSLERVREVAALAQTFSLRRIPGSSEA